MTRRDAFTILFGAIMTAVFAYVLGFHHGYGCGARDVATYFKGGTACHSILKP